MRLLILLLFIIPLSLFGQVESQFNGTLNVFSASRIGFTNTFTISGIFSSTTTSYTSANSAVGDIVQVQSGSRFYWMHIYSIASNSGGVITCNVRDSSSTLTAFPSGKWSIFRPTPNLRLPLSPDGETNASRSATFNTLALKVDEIQTSVASATNCEITLTKNNHGFSKWTPLYWTGSTFVRPTYDTLVPDYIVVDSLTANTFVVATCGTYPTTLADGIYWYTNQSPGYSLTQDTTKAPLFQVIDSTLILNPIVGFNLMSSSGGTADGNGIYSGSDSLSQTDTYAAMAADGSQSFGLGYFPDFPDRNYDDPEYGLFISPQNYGEISLSNGPSYISLFNGGSIQFDAQSGNNRARLNVDAGTNSVQLLAKDKSSSSYPSMRWDSSGITINNGASIDYKLIPNPITTQPSTTLNTTNILKWTGDGSNAVPSFSKIEDAFSGTARVVPYLNSGGRMVLGNAYFKLDTNTTSGAQARVRLLINNPNGDLGEGDSYSSLSVRTGDGLGSEAIANFGDQALTQATTGYDAVMQLSRTGGNFTTKSNLSNGNNVGKFAWRGYVNNGSRALGHIQLNYTGDGTTINSEILGASGVSGSVVNGWKLDNQSRFWLGSGADDYYFPTTAPSATSGAISNLIWTAGTPSFLRSQHGVATGTTDGSGDLTVTFAAAMPDATYSLLATVEGTTSYTISVHTKATGTCKVRFFNPATGAAVTATSVTISYEAKDY